MRIDLYTGVFSMVREMIQHEGLGVTTRGILPRVMFLGTSHVHSAHVLAKSPAAPAAAGAAIVPRFRRRLSLLCMAVVHTSFSITVATCVRARACACVRACVCYNMAGGWIVVVGPLSAIMLTVYEWFSQMLLWKRLRKQHAATHASQ